MKRLILTSMIAAGALLAQSGSGSGSGSAPVAPQKSAVSNAQAPATPAAKPAVKHHSKKSKKVKTDSHASSMKAPAANASASKSPVAKTTVAKTNVKTGKVKPATGDQKPVVKQ